MILYFAYGVLVLATIPSIAALIYISRNSIVKNNTFRIGFPMTFIFNFCNVGICFYQSAHIDEFLIRGLGALFSFTSMLFSGILHIETISIFRVLDDRISKWSLVILRFVMVFLYLIMLICNGVFYIHGVQATLEMDNVARWTRVCFAGFVALYLQISNIIWIHIVRNTLKKRNLDIVQMLLKRTEKLVWLSGVLLLSSMGVYIIYERLSFDHWLKSVMYVLTVAICIASATPSFALFVTVLQIQIESRFSKHGMQPQPVPTIVQNSNTGMETTRLERIPS